jgi:hypothetical protein
MGRWLLLAQIRLFNFLVRLIVVSLGALIDAINRAQDWLLPVRERKPCEVCGQLVDHQGTRRGMWLPIVARRHTAPCGILCINGGMFDGRPAPRPVTKEEMLRFHGRTCPVCGPCI